MIYALLLDIREALFIPLRMTAPKKLIFVEI